MIKKIALVAAALVAMFGLTAIAPASAAPPTGALTWHQNTNFDGEFVAISEGLINKGNTCVGLPVQTSAKSATNDTIGTATQVTEVKFFGSLTACQDPTATPFATLRPGQVTTDMGGGTATHYKAVLVNRI